VNNAKHRTGAPRLAALLLICALPGGAQAAPPPPAPLGAISVAGSPTGLVVLDGGARLVVGFEGRFGQGGGIVLLQRTTTGYAAAGTVRSAVAVEGLAVDPAGRTAVVTTRVGLAAVDLGALARGTAELSALRTGPAPDANQIVFARDGAHVFFTVQRYAELDVASVTPAVAGGKPGLEVVGRVALDRSPGGVALSPDGATLYVTSEADTADSKALAGAADSRLGREKCAGNLAPNGALSVVDVAKAIADPAHAVVARVAAGCAPTRVALSPDGAVAWVSVRAENRVLAFATAKLRDDAAHAFLAEAPVGDVPVGLALSLDGRRLLVANSHRSRDADDMRAANLSVLDPVAALAGKPALVTTLATGALAREVVAAPGGGFYVTNYLSKAIAVVKHEVLWP
jgi:DNA-binding beta-propeller fold protein YncE